MSGLSYISGYGDSEEELRSESEHEEENTEKDSENFVKIQKTKLPTPNLNNIAVVKTEHHFEDPTDHGGRIRSFPHIRGNWATFVYIHYPNSESFSKIINKLAETIITVDSSCQKCHDIHISLSKTFVLKYHMIVSFTKSLQEVLNNFESFELGFDSVAVYCNEDETRTFIALRVDTFSNRYLLDIVKKVDTILTDFRLPIFYENPSFHMSILDINGNRKSEILKILETLDNIFVQEEEKNSSTITINKIDCKSGNKHFQYPLK